MVTSASKPIIRAFILVGLCVSCLSACRFDAQVKPEDYCQSTVNGALSITTKLMLDQDIRFKTKWPTEEWTLKAGSYLPFYQTSQCSKIHYLAANLVEKNGLAMAKGGIMLPADGSDQPAQLWIARKGQSIYELGEVFDYHELPEDFTYVIIYQQNPSKAPDWQDQ